MKARYIRISTPDQKHERQLAKQHPDEKLFIDVCSGTIPFAEREQGSKLMKLLEEGHAILQVSVHAIDRLGRNTLDIFNTLQFFQDSGVCVRVDDLGIESMIKGKPNPVFKLIVSVLASISEMERNTLRERQLEGIEIAKAAGTYKGRVRGSKDDTDTILARYPNVVKYLNEGRLTYREIAKQCNCSPTTVNKVKKLL